METKLSTLRYRFTELNHLALAVRMGSFSSEVVCWGFCAPEWWRNYLHTHSFFEVCYVFQGRGIFRSNQRDYQIEVGEVFIARPGEIHEIISSEDQPLGIYFWAYTLIPHYENDRRIDEIDVLLKAFLASPQLVSSRTVAMQRTLDLLTEEICQREPGYLQVIQGLVVKLLLDTARAIVEVPQQTVLVDGQARTPEEAVVQMIVRYIRDNYNRSILVRDLAAQVHLSERHTSRLFHKVMGVSMMEYLLTLRIEIAAQLLLDRQLPIKEVAQEIGYPDVRYFITLFRQHRGITPALFRQKGGTVHLMA